METQMQVPALAGDAEIEFEIMRLMLAEPEMSCRSLEMAMGKVGMGRIWLALRRLQMRGHITTQQQGDEGRTFLRARAG